MKIKYNWGTGILISFIIFMSGSIIATVTFMNQKVDLVAKNYYDKELIYQEHIDKVNRSQQAQDKINIEAMNKSVQVSFNDSLNISVLKGEISFYRPSNSEKDFKLPLQLNKEGLQLIKTDKVLAGYWKVQVNWTLDKQDYYFEKSLILE